MPAHRGMSPDIDPTNAKILALLRADALVVWKAFAV